MIKTVDEKKKKLLQKITRIKRTATKGLPDFKKNGGN